MKTKRARCSLCNIEFEHTARTGPNPRHCSPECKAELHRRHSQERYAPHSSISINNCVECGRLFTSRYKRERPACSRRCAYRDLRGRSPQCSEDGCDKPTQGRGLCASHYSAWHRSQNKYTITCVACGQQAKVDRPTRKHCSTTCAATHGSQASAASVRTRYPRPVALYTGPRHTPPPIQWVKTAHRLTSGQCRVCDTWFVSLHTDITCSPQCFTQYHADQKRMAKERRRALQRRAFVENVIRKQVFNRDGYRCHICRRKTDPTKKTPHPRAPTIDHVIPLACGGKHEKTNCRTACFLCNSRKGDRGGGEQLLLIA